MSRPAGHSRLPPPFLSLPFSRSSLPSRIVSVRDSPRLRSAGGRHPGCAVPGRRHHAPRWERRSRGSVTPGSAFLSVQPRAGPPRCLGRSLACHRDVSGLRVARLPGRGVGPAPWPCPALCPAPRRLQSVASSAAGPGSLSFLRRMDAKTHRRAFNVSNFSL